MVAELTSRQRRVLESLDPFGSGGVPLAEVVRRCGLTDLRAVKLVLAQLEDHNLVRRVGNDTDVLYEATHTGERARGGPAPVLTDLDAARRASVERRRALRRAARAADAERKRPLRSVAKLTVRLRDDERAWKDGIAAASAAGFSSREIAKHAGVSHVRVCEIRAEITAAEDVHQIGETDD